MSEQKKIENQCKRFQNIITGERRVKRSKNSITNDNNNSNNNSNNDDNNNSNNNGNNRDNNSSGNNSKGYIEIKRFFFRENLEGICKYSKVSIELLLNFYNLL